MTSLSPPKSPTSHLENQEGGRRKRSACRPRSRRCLLKGCDSGFVRGGGAAALLRRGVPGGGAGLVAVEGPGEQPGTGGQTEANRRASVTGIASEPKTTSRRGRSEAAGSSRSFQALLSFPGCYARSCASGARRAQHFSRTSARVPWSASGNASDTGNGHTPVERNPARRCVQAVGMALPVNRDVLIGAGPLAYINLSRKEGDASAALGRQQSARSKVGGDRRSTTDTIAYTCRKRNGPWRGRWSAMGSCRRW